MPAASDAIQSHELDALFAGLGDVRSTEGVALAVSGGGDSTALMVLFADWLRQHGRDASAHVVLTVDHRLRPEFDRGGRRGRRARRAARLPPCDAGVGGDQAALGCAGGCPGGPLPPDERACPSAWARQSAHRPHPRRPGRDAADAARTRQRPRRPHGHGSRNALWGACVWCVRCWTCRSRGSWQPCDSARSPGSRTRATSRRSTSARACGPRGQRSMRSA